MFNKQPKYLTNSNKNGGYDCTGDRAGFDWWEGAVACGGSDLFVTQDNKNKIETTEK